MKIKGINYVFPIACLSLVVIFWRNNFLLTSLLLVLSVAILYLSKSKTEVLLFMIAGIAGAMAEIIAISAGAWFYSTPIILGIPLWLPLVWGLASIFIKRLNDKLSSLS